MTKEVIIGVICLTMWFWFSIGYVLGKWENERVYKKQLDTVITGKIKVANMHSEVKAILSTVVYHPRQANDSIYDQKRVNLFIPAIKYVRAVYGLNLTEAKKFADSVKDEIEAENKG